jgi:type II secretory pathway pseudopilin PulG
MPLRRTRTRTRLAGRTRTRLAAEEGFTMVLALGVLLVTSLLLTAVFFALQGETRSGTNDLSAKQAYAAASAGIESYLYELNQNPNYWGTCSNDTVSSTSVPGSSDGESFSYAPIYANGNTSCTSNVINSLIDTNTGTIRMVFTGNAGTNPVISRSIVVSFRMNSPLDFLWYTHFEAFDTSIPGMSGCGMFYRSGSRPSQCNIQWFTGDVMNGPMYTDDQYYIASGATPTFGRNASDKIESSEPSYTNLSEVCTGDSCGSATFNGARVPDATPIPTPSDNSELLTDAQNYGQVFSGTTTIALNGTTATVTNCPSTSSSCNSTTTVNIAQYPIIYVNNASGCSPTTYNPTSVTYSTNSSGNYAGCEGDVYISGNYSSPLTIAAANDIIIDSNHLSGAGYGVTTSADASGNPTGTATLGLVANKYVRVMHGCTGGNNVASQTLTNPTIDAAILALAHSFMNDNYGCGLSPGSLTIHGAIAQYFRGAVSTGSGSPSTGYSKNYNYDDRLANILPPYLFDISNSGWHISRETQCVAGSLATGSGCASTTG